MGIEFEGGEKEGEKEKEKEKEHLKKRKWEQSEKEGGEKEGKRERKRKSWSYTYMVVDILGLKRCLWKLKHWRAVKEKLPKRWEGDREKRVKRKKKLKWVWKKA